MDIQHKDKFKYRLDKLLDFLSNLEYEAMVSAGDVLGYLCGWFGEDDLPEDEIKEGK